MDRQLRPLLRAGLLSLLVGLVLAIDGGAQAPVSAPVPVPKPGYGGDYWTRNEQSWPTWKVVGPEGELVARRAEAFPSDWQRPEALLGLRWNIGQWPVVARFPKGALVQASPDAVGGNLVKDEDGHSWLRVTLDPSGTVGFVRCNKKWLVPVRQGTAPVPAPEETSSPDQ